MLREFTYEDPGDSLGLPCRRLERIRVLTARSLQAVDDGVAGVPAAGGHRGAYEPGRGLSLESATITYGFDQSFLDYFGDEGVRAVEKAFAMLNDLPPMSQIDLNAYPTDSASFNFEAQVLGLRDLKSQTLVILLNQLGLTEPTRFTYALRARRPSASGTNYDVMTLSFDPVTLTPSTNVNDVGYTYQIVDYAYGADDWEVQVDPQDPGYNAVTDRTLWRGGFTPG